MTDPTFKAEIVEQQAQHRFANRAVFFERDATHSGLHLIKSLTVEPASIVHPQGRRSTLPGQVRVHFVPETTDAARNLVRQDLRENLPVDVCGREGDAWFAMIPNSGVVTHDLVRGVLTRLYADGALTRDEVEEKAAPRLGIQPPDLSAVQKLNRPVGQLYDPHRPADEAQIAQMFAATHKPSRWCTS